MSESDGVTAATISPPRRERRTPSDDVAKQLRSLPRVDTVMSTAAARRLAAVHGRERVLLAVRTSLNTMRMRVVRSEVMPSVEAVIADADASLAREGRPSLRPVINGSGVIIHTNLGRAPLSEDAVDAMVAIARGCCNLEFDLTRGQRGSRYSHCGQLLAALSGADDGLVVNNNASSLLLILAGFARRREVIVSRGQLVEIGGGFRIPDVMRESGVELVEVGSTNRTYVRDYEAAITERTAALMLIHRSNFLVTGFVHDPDISELAALARARGILLIDDLGSGTFLDTDPYGLAHEPKVQERVAAGADLVCFSGDKLLGGPQAGYVVGRKPLIDTLKKVPMLRALRVDKVTLAGIEATLRHYIRGDATTRIPVWRSISAAVEALERRVRGWKTALALDDVRAIVASSHSTVGGGSLPGLTLPTRVLALGGVAPDVLADHLRSGNPPVVGRIEDGRLVIDPRTVMPHDDDALIAALRAALAAATKENTDG